jgi:hypothetical protein
VAISAVNGIAVASIAAVAGVLDTDIGAVDGQAWTDPPPPMPFDPYTSGLWSLWGYRLLVSTYLGPVLQVRRVSDDATMDMYPLVSGQLDRVTVQTWAGANVVYVSRFYDQSGAGNHFDPPSNATQPSLYSIVSTDVSFAVFDASDDGALAINDGGATAAKSIFQYRGDRGNTSKIGYEYGDGSLIGGGSNIQGIQELIVSGAAVEQYVGNSVASSYSSAQQSSAITSWMGSVYTPTAGTGFANCIKTYRNGSLLVNNGSSANVGSGSGTSSFAARRWRIGRRTDGLAAAINVYAVAITSLVI